MGNIRYQRTAHRITSAVNCRPLKPSPRSICPAAPYPTGVHIPGIPPPAKFATEPHNVLQCGDGEEGSSSVAFFSEPPGSAWMDEVTIVVAKTCGQKSLLLND